MRVEDPAIWVKPDKSVGGGDHMEVGLPAVVDVGVGLPDLSQHLDAQGQVVLAGKS